MLSAGLVRAMHHRACYGCLPARAPRLHEQQAVLSVFADERHDDEFVAASDRLVQLRGELARAEAQISQAESRAESKLDSDNDSVLDIPGVQQTASHIFCAESDGILGEVEDDHPDDSVNQPGSSEQSLSKEASTSRTRSRRSRR